MHRNPVIPYDVQGVPPAGLAKVQDPQLQEFITTCIQHDPAARPEARKLLTHTFFDSIRTSCCKPCVGSNGVVQPPLPQAALQKVADSLSELGDLSCFPEPEWHDSTSTNALIDNLSRISIDSAGNGSQQTGTSIASTCARGDSAGADYLTAASGPLSSRTSLGSTFGSYDGADGGIGQLSGMSTGCHTLSQPTPATQTHSQRSASAPKAAVSDKGSRSGTPAVGSAAAYSWPPASEPEMHSLQQLSLDGSEGDNADCRHQQHLQEDEEMSEDMVLFENGDVQQVCAAVIQLIVVCCDVIANIVLVSMVAVWAAVQECGVPSLPGHQAISHLVNLRWDGFQLLHVVCCCSCLTKILMSMTLMNRSAGVMASGHSTTSNTTVIIQPCHHLAAAA